MKVGWTERQNIHWKYNKVKRNKFYKNVMAEGGGLKTYWFDTKDEDPEYIEYLCILRYIAIKGEFPEFNNKLERKENKAIKRFDSITDSK